MNFLKHSCWLRAFSFLLALIVVTSCRNERPSSRKLAGPHDDIHQKLKLFWQYDKSAGLNLCLENISPKPIVVRLGQNSPVTCEIEFENDAPIVCSQSLKITPGSSYNPNGFTVVFPGKENSVKFVLDETVNIGHDKASGVSVNKSVVSIFLECLVEDLDANDPESKWTKRFRIVGTGVTGS